MSIRLHGGKTAPRLLLDLINYDPRKSSANGPNILTDIPFHDEETDCPPPLPPKAACRHQWCMKRNQSILPKDKHYSPCELTLWHFACYCAQCRSHLDLIVEFPVNDDNTVFSPCGGQDYPLHHFTTSAETLPTHRSNQQPERTDPWNKEDRDGEKGAVTRYVHSFQCTSPFCAARLTVHVKPPRLSREWVIQLTDRYVIRARAEKAMAADPVRFEGIAFPTPSNVLEYLLSYLKDALFAPEVDKKIKLVNKKFATSFGDACSDLLRYLGFSQVDDYWLPPRPDPSQQSPYQDQGRILLDDVIKELYVLVSKEIVEHSQTVKLSFQHELALTEMKSALACTEYKQSIRSRTVDLTIDEHPCYAGLGTVADFDDELVSFAYERQIDCDPDNIPYYLECLQVLGVGRKSDDLQTKVAIQHTLDRVSMSDIKQAYLYLGLNRHDAQLADDTIIGTFQARVADSPKYESEMRNALRIISQDRRSDKIKMMASRDVTTYEQALHFLSASDDTPDDFIPSLVGVKVSEKSTDEKIARQAVALIANRRKSNALKHWLETGTLGELEMDVGQAYARLSLSNQTVDDDLVLVAYNSMVDDQPSQLADLNRALTAIAKSRDSEKLRQELGITTDSRSHRLSDWPVGIENIGNTCYLNSLLQFYFTIKPLRELVLGMDEHKMPIDEHSLSTKRVGSRNVSKREVQRSQRFVEELETLFKDLVTHPGTSLKPNPDVARLTLLSSSKAEAARRQSMISAERPSALVPSGHVNGHPVEGPAGPPNSQSAQGDDKKLSIDGPVIQDSQKRVVDGKLRRSASSETLVDDDIAVKEAKILNSQTVESQQRVLEDKENLPPSKSASAGEDLETAGLRPLSTTSPSRLNEHAGETNARRDKPESIDLTGETASNPEVEPLIAATHGPPSRPPPFPPRPQPNYGASDAIKEAEYGAQQDVTEVIANVLFQLQCAIKPESIDENGEQLDMVKTLFFGKQKSYTTDKKGVIRTKEEYISDIKVDVASGPRDIYAALDGAFDVQDVEVAGGIEPQYATISSLPPVLSILIQRAQFDPQRKTTFKSNNHLELRETIYMDRYMDATDPELSSRREESWAWKRQITDLEKRRMQLTKSELGMNVPDILAATRQYLQQVKDLNDPDVDVSQPLLDSIETAATESKEDLAFLELQIKDLQTKINTQFSDLRAIPYRLASVFIHVGSHNTGHYWIYIYDFAAKIWRKYNDEKVTEVGDIREIFEAPGTSRPPTPYYLVYVKDEMKAQLVDPVCRTVSEPVHEEHADVTMQDYEDVPIVNGTDTVNDQIRDTYAGINKPQTQMQQVMADGNGFREPDEAYSCEVAW